MFRCHTVLRESNFNDAIIVPVDLIIYAYIMVAHCAVIIIAHCALVPVPGDEDAILAL